MEQLGQIRAHLESRLNRMLYVPEELSIYATVNKGIDLPFFEQLVVELTRQLPVFENISLAPDNTISYVFPPEGNEMLIGFNYLEHPLQKIDVQRAIHEQSSIITGPVDLIQGGKAFIVRSPIFLREQNSAKKGAYWGMVSMVINYDALIDDISKQLKDTSYTYAIRGRAPDGKQNQVFFGPDDLFGDKALIQQMILPGGDHWELSIRPKEGWLIWGYYSPVTLFSLFFFHTLLAILVYIFIVNFGRLKELNRDNLTLIDELRQMNQTQHRLYSIIAHDLREPFTTLVSSLEVMEMNYEDMSGNELHAHIREMYKQSQALNFLSDNLLNWIRSQRHEIGFTPEAFLLTGVVEEITHVLLPLADKKNLQLVSEVPAPGTIRTDRQMLLIVLRNLLANAIKFTPPGGEIAMKFRIESDSVSIEIRDTGIGMEQARLNELLTREVVDSTRGTEGEKGTGLGLLLCREFIAMMNGSIHGESTPGEGTVLHLRIPQEIMESGEELIDQA